MLRQDTLLESVQMIGRESVTIDEDVLEDLLSVITEDAWEELDELSKKTLKSYHSKRLRNADRPKHLDSLDRSEKRLKWIKKGERAEKFKGSGNRWVNKVLSSPGHDKRTRLKLGYVTKESVDLDEAWTIHPGTKEWKKQQYMTDKVHAGDRSGESLESRVARQNEAEKEYNRKQRRKMKKESAEIDLDALAEVLYSLSEEELGYLDELSNRTLGRYVRRASKDAVTNAFILGNDENKDDRLRRKVRNRAAGLSRVGDRLRKMK